MDNFVEIDMHCFKKKLNSFSVNFNLFFQNSINFNMSLMITFS